MCMVSSPGPVNTLKMRVVLSEKGEIRKINIQSTSVAGKRVWQEKSTYREGPGHAKPWQSHKRPLRSQVTNGMSFFERFSRRSAARAGGQLWPTGVTGISEGMGKDGTLFRSFQGLSQSPKWCPKEEINSGCRLVGSFCECVSSCITQPFALSLSCRMFEVKTQMNLPGTKCSAFFKAVNRD